MPKYYTSIQICVISRDETHKQVCVPLNYVKQCDSAEDKPDSVLFFSATVLIGSCGRVCTV